MGTLELITIIVGAPVLAALVTWFTTRRLKNAEADQVQVQTSLLLLQPLRDELKEVRKELAALRKETELCHRERDADRKQYAIEREADRSRIRTLEEEVAHYKAGPTAHYHLHQSTTSEEGETP